MLHRFKIFLLVSFLSFFLAGHAFAKDDWQEALNEARMSLIQGDFDKTIKKYEKALSLGPDEIGEMDIVTILGALYVMQEDYEKAIPRLDRAIELLEKEGLDMGRLFDAYVQRAKAAEMLGDPSGAKHYRQQAEALTSQQTGGTQEVWSLDEKTGLLIHNPTKSEFPQAIAGFVRGEYQAYQDDGSDVGITFSFQDGGSNAVLTVYLSFYPDFGLDQYFKETKAAVFGQNPLTIRTIGETRFLRPSNDEKVQTYGAIRGEYAYSQDDSLDEMGTEIWIAQQQNFYFKIRLSYPMEMKNEVTEAAFDFVEKSSILIDSHMLALIAGKKFDIDFCPTYTPQTAGTETISAEPASATNVSVLIEAVAQKVAPEPAASTRCIIDLNDGSDFLKLLNMVHEAGERAEGQVIEVPLYELVLYGEDWALDSRYLLFPSSVLPEVVALEGGEPGPYFYLVRDKDDVFEIYDIYRGTPDVSEIKEHLVEIIQGQRKPAGRVYIDEENNVQTEIIVPSDDGATEEGTEGE